MYEPARTAHGPGDPGTVGLTVAGVLGAGVLGAAVTLADNKAGLLVPLAALVGLGVAAIVFWRPMLGVYGAILAIPLEFARFQFGSSFSITPTKVLIVVTAGVLVVRVVLGRTRLEIPRPHLAFAGFLAVIATGLIVAQDHLVTERILVVWTSVWIVSTLLTSSDEDQVRRMMVCIALSGAVLGVVALAGAGPQQLGQAGAVATNRASGSFTHPNQLGAFFVLALPVAIVLTGSARAWMRPLMLGAVALMVAGLSLTLARAAIVAVVAGGFVLLAWPAYRRALLAVFTVLLIIALADTKLLETQQFRTLVTRIGTVQHVSQSAGERPLIWSKTPHIIADHPLIGIGEGNFAVVSPQYGATDFGAPFDHAHDVVLTIGAETGLIGLGFFVLFALGTAVAGVRALMGPARTRTRLALGLLAAYFGTFVLGLTDYPLGQDADFAVIMIEAGLLVALGRQAGEAASRGAADAWWRAAPGGRLVPRFRRVRDAT